MDASRLVCVLFRQENEGLFEQVRAMVNAHLKVHVDNCWQGTIGFRTPAFVSHFSSRVRERACMDAALEPLVLMSSGVLC